MRLARGALEGVDTVAPASDKGVPTDVEVPHLNKEYCQQLAPFFAVLDRFWWLLTVFGDF